MSDEDVIRKFAGNGFQADGSFQCKDPTKVEWFPPPGMKLRLDMKKVGTKVHAKIKLELLPNTSFQGKQAIEGATYIVDGNKLISAAPLVFQPGLTAKETLVMSTDPKTMARLMVHNVKFSDDVEGNWTCPDKS